MVSKLEKTIYLILTIFSLICAVTCLFLAGARFGAFFFFCLFAGVLILYAASITAWKNRFSKILLIIGRTVLICWIVSFVIVECFIFLGEQTDIEAKEADCYIILGAGVNGRTPSLSMLSRLEAAYSVLSENPDSVAILTGGQGEGEEIPESHAMHTWLFEHGIDDGRLFIEDASLNTIENLENARNIIFQNNIPINKGVAIVTNEFHLWRAMRLMELEGIKAYGVSAETPYAYLKAVYHIREYFSVMGLLLTGRLM